MFVYVYMVCPRSVVFHLDLIQYILITGFEIVTTEPWENHIIVQERLTSIPQQVLRRGGPRQGPTSGVYLQKARGQGKKAWAKLLVNS